MYFVTTGLKEEISIIKKVRPPRLLCSYWYFKNKLLKDFINSLGYRPEIMLDSGAYSAFTKGKSVNLLDYMEYINANALYIDRYVSLDVIGDGYTTRSFFDIMKHKGFNPIPVYHYGDDIEQLRFYIESGEKIIALGNTVRIRDKDIVARWCADVHKQNPHISLHLLGSSSHKIVKSESVDSCDSSTWYMMAVNGKPEKVPGKTRASKMLRAEANMIKTMEVFNETAIPFDDRDGKHIDGEV